MTFFYLVKDYIEVVHKLIETSPSHVLQHSTYTDSLTILSFGLSSFKQLCINFLSFEWFKQLWYFPIIVPEIATSMMEEISVLDGNFHNLLTFLDKPLAAGNEVYGNYYLPLTCFEKIFTGLINSLFIWLPTSTATFICFRRFMMQGVEAGYSAALGTMAATLFWFTSIIFGFRFIVVPWMSLDLFRYWLGFLLLMKYFWDNRYAYKEVKHNSVFGKQTKINIFAFHFLLALTEQTSLYPFLSNLSISSQSTLLEGFPSENLVDFTLIHFSYLLGLAIGSYSLINLLAWFWQDPAYRFYFWIMNKFKKLRVADIVRPVHLFFQSITVLFAFSSLPYFGIEYQVTNPLGFVPNDQVFHQFKQTSFLTHSTSPAYYRSRLNFPRQKFFRYEDWAEYYHRNTPTDTSLYDQGAYRLYTMEDLSYGKDYEWMRRRSDKIKIRSRLKRLRWFPRNWANRLWEFTKTWSRRNVLWRNDILNMYQYSWDSKAPIIWNKFVFEEFFPTSFGKSNSNPSANKETNVEQKATKKQISKNWDSFWGPDPDWTTKFLSNQQSLNNIDPKFRLNSMSRFNVSDNDVWWKWLSSEDKSQNKGLSTPAFQAKLKQDFWEPQKRLISIYSENTNLQKQELNLEFSTLRKFVRKLTARLKLSTLNKGSEHSSLNWSLSGNSGGTLSEKKSIWYTPTIPSNSLKTLLITPSLKDWTVFQTLLTNLQNVLWWKERTNSQEYSSSSKMGGKFYPNGAAGSKSEIFEDMLGRRDFSLTQRLESQQNDFDSRRSPFFFSRFETNFQQIIQDMKNDPTLGNFPERLRAAEARISSDNQRKFEKLQEKYRHVQNKQKILRSAITSEQTNNSLKPDVKFAVRKPGGLSTTEQLANSLKLLKPNVLSNNSIKIRPTSTSMNGKNANFLVFLNKNKPTFPFDGPSAEEMGTLSEQNSSSTLLHPVKYYLHKEQNFKRKLRFYGVKNSHFSDLKNISANPELSKGKTPQSLSLLNNRSTSSSQSNIPSSMSENQSLLLLKNKNKLQIFNFYLKTYFQTYKKTKLYVLNTKMKRQLGMGASARRKGRDYSNKLLKRAKILSNTPWIRQWIDQSGFLARRKRLETWIARQHYDPNELWAKIMKNDVDLFMKRQPSSYFLTTTEENLLHLRRFLLFEYYDSLRWYTYMTNYRSMKNSIGGTKSFTNKLYNQQFKGTFHKVRHLFSLTPSASNGSLLKFDRPLYNIDSSNNLSSVLDPNISDLDKTNMSGGPTYHEELTNSVKLSLDLIEDSSKNLQKSISDLFETKTNNYNQTFPQERQTGKNIGTQKSGTFNISLLGVKQNTFQNEIIKNNLQKKLMMKILQLRKKQKWTVDYKRASEKLWKKWKFNSNIQEPKSLVISKPQLPLSNKRGITSEENFIERVPISIPDSVGDTQERNFEKNAKYLIRRSLSEDSNSFAQNSITKKLVQMKKLELFEAKKMGANESLSASNTSTLRPVPQNYLLAKGLTGPLSENTVTRRVNFQQMFHPNIFTRKFIYDRYKKLVHKKLLIIENLGKSEERKDVVLSFYHPRSLNVFRWFNLNLQRLIKDRTLDNSTIQLRGVVEKSRLNNWQRQPLSPNLATNNNIQVYEINKIKQERSNIQNFVFMKKFLVNDTFSPLTRSQLRPLPGKRTKALYDKLASTKSNVVKGSSSVFQTYFVSSSLDKDVKILFYQNLLHKSSSNLATNRTDLKGRLTETPERTLTVEGSQGDSLLLSRLNQKWKVFVNTVKNAPDLVSNQLDQTLQTKLIKDQNEKLLTTALKAPLLSKTDVQQNFFAVTNASLRDSSGLKNLALQKLTKTLLSKQKNVNSHEKPMTSRITKSARKRQQDFVTRSLLKRHLNLKSRRKLFLKTKEMNNQRMVLDRKYEIQERVFLNKIGFLSDVKNALETPSNENIVKAEAKYENLSKTLLPGFSPNKSGTQTQFLEAKNSVLKFHRWWLGSTTSNRETFNAPIAKNAQKNSFISRVQTNKQRLNYLSALSIANVQKEMTPLLPQNTISKFPNKSYLSSTKRSTLFMDKILNQHKLFGKESSEKYLKDKLNQNFALSLTLENEKSSLRRTLRKFSTKTSVPFTNETIQNVKTSSKLNKPENSFINNLLLKTWLIRRGTNGLTDSAQGLSTLSSGSFSDKMKKSERRVYTNRKDLYFEPGLISLNKYIMFARNNQNKLSRQQIRKKLKKRRIIRMKRTERLKTLKDHPLKFRSEQIQTFYNIRDSLKKWKNGWRMRDALARKTGQNNYSNAFFSIPNKSNDLVEINSYKNSQKLSYKPLNFFQRVDQNLAANGSFSRTLGLESQQNDFDSVPNLSIAQGDFANQTPSTKGAILTALYKDIFVINKQNFIGPERKPLLVNTTNMPFYAGWDESLRKFVLTNRLLNRREAGYQSSKSTISPLESSKTSLDQEDRIVFSLWPLKGTNPATTLFSQFPFMTAPQTNLTTSGNLATNRSLEGRLTEKPRQIRSIKSGTKYDLETSFNLNKLPNQIVNSHDVSTFDKKWQKKSTNGETPSYLNLKKMNRMKSFIKSSKTDEQLGIRQSGQVISNLANPTTRKLARHALFSGRSGLRNLKKSISTPNQNILNQNLKLFVSKNFNKFESQSIDKKLSTKILLLRNLRQGNRAQTQLAYIRRLQKTLRPTGSSWKTNQVLSRRKKQRIKQSNFWGMPQNEASTRFSVRKRKKRGNNKNPRLRGDKNYKKTKRQYRQKLYLRPKNKPLRRRSLGVNFKNKLNYWRRNYQYLSVKNVTSNLAANRNDLQNNLEGRLTKQEIPSQKTPLRTIVSQNLKTNSIYSQRDKEWDFLNKFEKQSSVTRRPRQLYRSLFRNPTVQTPILYTTLPGHSRSIPLIKNLPLPGSSVKTLNRVIKWSSADGASRFYRVNLSYGWAMKLFLNNLRQKVNAGNFSSVNSLIKAYLNELEKTNQMKFSSSREFKRRVYKLRQLSYTMSLRLYDRWFFYYYKTTNSNPQKGFLFEVTSPVFTDENNTFDQNGQTNINNKIKQSIFSAIHPVEQTVSPFKHIKKFLTFPVYSSRSVNSSDSSKFGAEGETGLKGSEKDLENQKNFRSYLKSLRNTATASRRNINETITQNKVTENKQTTNPFDEIATQSSIGPTGQQLSLGSDLQTKKTNESQSLDNFKLFPSENKDDKNFDVSSQQTNFFSSDKKENQDGDFQNSVKSNKTLLKKEKKYAEDRFFFAQFNKPPLVDDYRLTLENNRHYPLNGGFVWPGDYLRLQTILLPKEMKDIYLLTKVTDSPTQFLKDKKKD